MVKHVGNIKLSDKIVLKDGLVVHGYKVCLISVHKLAKDDKFVVSFTESKCFVQDSLQKSLMGTGSEKIGLYMFDSSRKLTNSNISSCFLSNCLWHNRLDHSSDQVLTILKDKNQIDSLYDIQPCDVCHNAKQTSEPFPLSDHKTKYLVNKSDEPYDDNRDTRVGDNDDLEAVSDPRWVEVRNQEMKALNSNSTCIEVLETSDGLCLNQKKICMKLLSEYGMLACKPAKAPIPDQSKKKKDKVEH
uniref:Ribonuclease H-like domain-containing protein n=1 Tax=Tanacetum cinerariifolium TaxID=118510 RepID=A0A699H3Q0_TANCI|nr:ribonuclease H-like domain-containing protein [Tanacetum cinerariifolium]